MSRILIERGSNFRRRRILLKQRSACYHLVSRAPFGFYMLESIEARRMFVDMMRRQAGFCGIEILSYCVMSNHVHLLVRVPYLEESSITDNLLLKRYRSLYGGEYVPFSSYSLAEVRDILEEDGPQAKDLRSALKNRMGNVSVFMRELKQRYAIWYNSTYQNKGAVWAGRFMSQPIEDSPSVLQIVAAYIDLNPVRAEMVKDPKDYPSSSYGAAGRGESIARSGYCSIFNISSWNALSGQYRMFLLAKGTNHKSQVGCSFSKDKGVVSKTVMDKNQNIPVSHALHERCVHFIRGGALGSDVFVEEVFSKNRELFSDQRKEGARKIRGSSVMDELRVLRDLK